MAVRTRCSIFLTSWYLLFLDGDGFDFWGDDRDIADEEAVLELDEEDDMIEDAEVEACDADDASTPSRALRSATSLLCVAMMEHLRHMQSLRISKRV
jgi:hypothetical protein